MSSSWVNAIAVVLGFMAIYGVALVGLKAVDAVPEVRLIVIVVIVVAAGLVHGSLEDRTLDRRRTR